MVGKRAQDVGDDEPTVIMHGISGSVSQNAWATYPTSLKPKVMMSVHSFQLGHCRGQQGPLHEVRMYRVIC